MASREVIVLECDLCGRSENNGTIVTTHQLTVDKVHVEFEACDRCWDKRVLHVLAPLSKNGRKPAPPKVPKPKTTPWPGTAWHFTSHALERLGQRRITPLDAIAVVEDPSTTHPGKPTKREPNATVFWRDNLKVVADPARQVVYTVANRDE